MRENSPSLPESSSEYMAAHTVIPAGILFPPNGSGKMYISLYIHRGHRFHKHQWVDAITPHHEHDIFCGADAANWRDANGDYWSVSTGGNVVLGTRGERLSKFPSDENPLTPGYPASPLEEGDKDCPPDAFVEQWITAQVITRVIGRRIQKRKL